MVARHRRWPLRRQASCCARSGEGLVPRITQTLGTPALNKAVCATHDPDGLARVTGWGCETSGMASVLLALRHAAPQGITVMRATPLPTPVVAEPATRYTPTVDGTNVMWVFTCGSTVPGPATLHTAAAP